MLGTPNHQETDRSGVNELIDEKTLMELYGPPFHAGEYFMNRARLDIYRCI